MSIGVRRGASRTGNLEVVTRSGLSGRVQGWERAFEEECLQRSLRGILDEKSGFVAVTWRGDPCAR